MAKYTPWKAFERRFAKLMGGTRLWRPDYSDSEPDGESDTHTWDCKAYLKIWAITRYVEAEKKYREHAAGRRFVLALFAREHKNAGDFVLVRAPEYARDQRILERLDAILSKPDVDEHGCTRVISLGALRQSITEAEEADAH